MSRTRELIKRVTRSRHWGKVRDRWLKEHPECIATGRRKQCEVHHIVPFSVRPEWELADGTGEYCQCIDPITGKFISNLCTLSDHPTAPAHRFVGHLSDWRCANDHVIKDSALWLQRIKGRKR